MSTFGELFGASPGSGEDDQFLVRWRGRQEGPYSASVIESKLASNQIGLLHEIFHNGQWITIRDCIAQREIAIRAEQQAREDNERRGREEAEHHERALEARQREAALAEEKRRNDLLELAAKPPDFSTFLQGANPKGSSSRDGIATGVFKAILSAVVVIMVAFFFYNGCSLH